eukprot:evm.model.scf_168.7 EVM.evm.TU.scf_168.7   scf_168:47481-47906(+)
MSLRPLYPWARIVIPRPTCVAHLSQFNVPWGRAHGTLARYTGVRAAGAVELDQGSSPEGLGGISQVHGGMGAAFEKSCRLVSRWVVFSDLHVSSKTLDTCMAVLRRVREEAEERSAGIVFLGAKHWRRLPKINRACGRTWR